MVADERNPSPKSWPHPSLNRAFHHPNNLQPTTIAFGFQHHFSGRWRKTALVAVKHWNGRSVKMSSLYFKTDDIREQLVNPELFKSFQSTLNTTQWPPLRRTWRAQHCHDSGIFASCVCVLWQRSWMEWRSTNMDRTGHTSPRDPAERCRLPSLANLPKILPGNAPSNHHDGEHPTGHPL